MLRQSSAEKITSPVMFWKENVCLSHYSSLTSCYLHLNGDSNSELQQWPVLWWPLCALQTKTSSLAANLIRFADILIPDMKIFLSTMAAALAVFKEQPSDFVITTCEIRNTLNVNSEGREGLQTNESADLLWVLQRSGWNCDSLQQWD